MLQQQNLTDGGDGGFANRHLCTVIIILYTGASVCIFMSVLECVPIDEYAVLYYWWWCVTDNITLHNMRVDKR